MRILIAWWSHSFFRTILKTTGNSTCLLFAEIILRCLSLYRYFLFLFGIQRLFQLIFALWIAGIFTTAWGNQLLLVLKLDWLRIDLAVVQGVVFYIICHNTANFWASIRLNVTIVDLNIRPRMCLELGTLYCCVGSTMELLLLKSLLWWGLYIESCAVLQDWLHGLSVFACSGTSSRLD